MRPMMAIITLLFAVTASAETLQEWKTPDGKTYFGDHPPQGSTIVRASIHSRVVLCLNVAGPAAFVETTPPTVAPA